MANYKGHIAGAATLSAAYAVSLSYVPVEQFAEAAGVLQDWQTIAAIFVIGMLFGLFPDVDTNSKAQNLFIGAVFIIDILLIINGDIEAAAYLGLIALTPVVGKHRGWTHSKWAMFLVPLPILIVPYLYNEAILPAAVIYYGAAVIGYFSHLLLDGLVWRRFRVKN